MSPLPSGRGRGEARIIYKITDGFHLSTRPSYNREDGMRTNTNPTYTLSGSTAQGEG